jgi:transposase
MKTPRKFRPYTPDQLLLLPLDMREWLPNDHLVYFVRDVVRELDLSAITRSYEGALGGQPPYDPEMMTSLLIYAYCVGISSSRKIEKATQESVPFRVMTSDQQPDHDTIAAFRKRHLGALKGLFLQVLQLCRQAKLVKLGHVALDGTKVRANASKHKAMSYQRMEKTEAELEAVVKRLLEKAQAVDDAEDELYGQGKRGDELPEELRHRETRLAKIREAKAALEKEAREQAEKQQQQPKRKKSPGRPPKQQAGKPKPKAQRNFTDPESRIMIDGATKSFEQCYNCQAAVDDKSQIIVAAGVTQQANDKQQMKPMIKTLIANLGAKPKRASADSGYFSKDNLDFLINEKIDPYIATGRIKHSDKPLPVPRGRIPKNATPKQRMARKLRTIKGHDVYKKRKQIVEPVFGQIKGRGYRRFLFRGLAAVEGEWDLICTTHNLLKLFRSGWRPAKA